MFLSLYPKDNIQDTIFSFSMIKSTHIKQYKAIFVLHGNQ